MPARVLKRQRENDEKCFSGRNRREKRKASRSRTVTQVPDGSQCNIGHRADAAAAASNAAAVRPQKKRGQKKTKGRRDAGCGGQDANTSKRESENRDAVLAGGKIEAWTNAATMTDSTVAALDSEEAGGDVQSLGSKLLVDAVPAEAPACSRPNRRSCGKWLALLLLEASAAIVLVYILNMPCM
jgi:hypothetical protein